MDGSLHDLAEHVSEVRKSVPRSGVHIHSFRAHQSIVDRVKYIDAAETKLKQVRKVRTVRVHPVVQ
jgi:hypothetical protein